jgi:predicted GIY-YIG superfamily endonuclease
MMKCVKCGRHGHTFEDCFARSHIDGGAPKKNFVYSLTLENGRKYVGRTNNLEQRMDAHFSGQGAQFTQKYRPVEINHIQACNSEPSSKKAETIVYKNMRDYHGVDVVRGAGHTSSGCSRCGRESHDKRNCYATTHVNGYYL